MEVGYNVRFDLDNPMHKDAHKILTGRDKKKYRKAADLISAALLAYDPDERRLVMSDEDIRRICSELAKEMERNGMVVRYDEIGI